MREPEAAEYLGLTPRTLRNYRRKGTLPFRETKGRTRPVIEYDQADLDRLKAELRSRSRRHRDEGTTPVPRSRVTLGLTRGEYDELAADASKMGMAVSDYARRLVRDRLESQYLAQAAEMRTQIEATKRDLVKLRARFAEGIEAVLEYAGLPAAEAKKWVSKNLR